MIQVIRAGDVQRMSKGTGITHSKLNLGSSPASLILIDVPSCKGWGYDAEVLRGARRE